MKRTVLSLLMFLFIGQLLAQTDIFYTEGLSTEDKSLVRKAQSDIQRADRYYQSSLKIYNQYRALLESSKKSKQKKGEKKTVQGKLNLKQAAYYYDKGYSTLFEIYFNHVANIKFQLEENQQKAKQLASEAEGLFNQGQKMLKTTQNYTEKDFKKRVKFKKMLNTVNNGRDNELKAIRLLIEAIKIYNNETAQIQQMRKADDQAWQKALNENTIDAYQSYISNFPTGRHISEARAKIEELKQQQLNQTDTTILDYTNNPTIDLVYRVQILADKKPWSASRIRSKIYRYYGKDGKPTYKLVINGWYKYYVGEYKTYAEAKTVADAMGLTVKTGPFVVAFLNGEPIDIKKAIKIEEQMMK